MISVYDIKPKFQQLLAPVLRVFRKAGVSPNMITWWAILLSCGTGVVLWIHPYGLSFLLLPLVLLLRMALNALDGMMAKTYNLQSKSGELLNELGDVVSDFCLFFPLLLLFNPNLYLLLAFLFLSLINEFVGVLGKVISGERRYDGPMGKSDRALLIGVVSIVFYVKPSTLDYVNYIFCLALVLLTISTSIRIIKTLK
jgi:CDP-diacylglycerol--glycerol-3-phosphate 3-phosphatidyltransferase